MSGAVALDQASIDSLQRVLAAEHAALWCYTLVLAFVPADQATQARKDIDEHRTLRTQVEQTLTDVGARPVSAQPAYATGVPVTDVLSAGRLIVTAENDVLAGWRSVLEQTTSQQLRVAALQALSAGVVRASRWRAATGTLPTVPALPGIER
ncbi:hypothetical protein GCM10009836_04750 [Pseudonocardia ailaonensis]|uniref:DUF4439 domain-containing protein n=1 Tax=Pseudonocardia ailaonensis TaxID=367279 RepID=A0ABN2MLC0_9PSEU